MNFEIQELPIDSFGVLWHAPIPFQCLAPWRESKIVLNSAEKFYRENMVYFLSHEWIHYILLGLEGRDACDAFDNLFPSLFHTRCLIDGEFERLPLWKVKHQDEVS